MILLDTNVISETIRSSPDQRVIGWLDGQRVEVFYVASISIAELLLGAEMLPDGKRKGSLQQDIDGQLTKIFSGRTLNFDRKAAGVYAKLVGFARSKGHTVSAPDGQIAAIAVVNKLTVATRDIGPFQAMRVPVVNPWES